MIHVLGDRLRLRFGVLVGRLPCEAVTFHAACSIFVDYRRMAAAELQRRERLS